MFPGARRPRAVHPLRTLVPVHGQDARPAAVLFGGLHTRNLLVDDQDTVSLIDFELSMGVRQARPPTLAAPGFRVPADRTGFAIDDYALAVLLLSLFLPLHMLLPLDPDKLDDYLDRGHAVPGATPLRRRRQAGNATSSQAGGTPVNRVGPARSGLGRGVRVDRHRYHRRGHAAAAGSAVSRRSGDLPYR